MGSLLLPAPLPRGGTNPFHCEEYDAPRVRRLKSLVGYRDLVFVTPFWRWVADRESFWGRRARNEERCVEHRLDVALVAHEMHFAVTFDEALARLVDALVTPGVIFGHGTRLDRNQNDTGMMVPAGRASGFDDDLYDRKVCRTLQAFHLDALVLGFELPGLCSRYLGRGHWGRLNTRRGVGKRCSHD